jgi:hypothetical protein
MQGGSLPPDVEAPDGPPLRGPSYVPGDTGAPAGPAMQQDESAPADAPPLDESVRRIADAGQALAGSVWGTFKAFRALVVADLALSRSAAGRILVLGAVGTALGASAWLFGMGLMVVVLRGFDMPWWLAIAIPTLVSAAGAALCALLALRAFELTRFQATRRQLAKIGIGDDPDDVDRNPERVP